MNQGDANAQLVAQFRQTGRDLVDLVERRIAGLTRGDVSGWYYVDATAVDTADGRHQAYIKPFSGAAGPGNKQLGPFPCLRSYTPVVGHRVLVRWIAGDRADGVIEG